MIKALFRHKVDRSSSSHAILEEGSRTRKAEKIAAILSEITDLSRAHVLDIGTGSGQIAHELSRVAGRVSSVDMVDERRETDGYDFRVVADEALPFTSDMFDIVVTNHVIEHTSQQRQHVDEALRVLRPGGHLYLATPNKYWLADPHYKLPFVSWLPRTVSQRYLRMMQGAEWDIYPLSRRGVRRLLKGCDVTNALPMLLITDAAEKLDTWTFVRKAARFVPERLLGLTEYMSPTLIYLVRERP